MLNFSRMFSKVRGQKWQELHILITQLNSVRAPCHLLPSPQPTGPHSWLNSVLPKVRAFGLTLLGNRVFAGVVS